MRGVCSFSRLVWGGCGFFGMRHQDCFEAHPVGDRQKFLPLDVNGNAGAA